MDYNKLLNDDCAAVAQKFAGQIINYTRLQREMQWGYNRAARMIDLLEDRGIIGPGEGAKPREILVQMD